MRTRRLVGVLALALGLFLALSAGLQPTQAAPVTCDRFVLGTDGSDTGNDCSGEAHPCRTVQHAIDQAVDGDTICVASNPLAGPCTYPESLVITKSITLDGAWVASCIGPPLVMCDFSPAPCNPANVTLDAKGLGRVISTTGASPTIQCFTITGGDAGGGTTDPPKEDDNKGGGIAAWNAAPIILSNVISGNYGCTTFACNGDGRGGGIYLINSPATAVISGNLIANNVADDATWGQGGGIYLENASAQVLSNTIQTNRAGHSTGDGGGIYVRDGSPAIAGNRILTNTAGMTVLGNGGGIFVYSNAPVTIERNLIQRNVALRDEAGTGFYGWGGGIYFGGPLALIRDNQVYGNVANLLDERGLGGGMCLRGLSAAAEVSGNTVANDNRASHVADGKGGGLYLDDSYATVRDNRVFGNIASSETPGYGGGVYVNGGGGVFQDNSVTTNMAVLGAVGGWGWGGGMAISGSTVLVQDNTIAKNIADSAPSAWGAGGGVYVWSGSPRFVGNDVLDNATGGNGGGYGGGFELAGCAPWLEGNTILGNRVTGVTAQGGGVRVASCHAFTMTNNIIARNSVSTTGAGVYIASSGAVRRQVAHNAVVANLGGDGIGVYVGGASVVAFTNNIIVSQTVGITNAVPAGTTVTATQSLFEGNGLNYGVGVDSVNEVPGPAMLLPDYHLSPGSNAIDHGIPLAWVTRDVDGDPRPMGPAPDVGADEWVRARLYLSLVLRNF